MRDTFIKTLCEMARQDERITLITGDLGFCALDPFANEFPERFINVGVAEQNMIGIATGLALDGAVVYTYSIANFAFMRCLEQIRNDATYHEANVNVVAIGGGFSYGPLGMSHHATEDLAIMRAIGDLTILAPCDLWEVEKATEALAQTSGTTFLRLDKSHASIRDEDRGAFRLGEARQVRQGGDITLAAIGSVAEVAWQAAEELAEVGIEASVLNVHSLRPLDTEAFKRSVRETSGLITIEEHTVDGGLGGAVAEYLLESGNAPACFHRVGVRNGLSTIVGSQEYLREQHQIDARSIVNKVQEWRREGRLSPARKLAA